MARTTQTDNNWNLYKIQRNKCTKLVNKDKDNFFTEKYEKHIKENDAKNQYSTSKKQVGWATGGSFLMGGKIISAPQKVAQIQLEYFEEKIKKIMRKLDGNKEDPLKYLKIAMQKWSHKDGRPKLKLRTLNLAETANFVKQLGNSTVKGTDNIDAKILHKPIMHITNLSITEL